MKKWCWLVLFLLSASVYLSSFFFRRFVTMSDTKVVCRLLSDLCFYVCFCGFVSGLTVADLVMPW